MLFDPRARGVADAGPYLMALAFPRGARAEPVGLVENDFCRSAMSTTARVTPRTGYQYAPFPLQRTEANSAPRAAPSRCWRSPRRRAAQCFVVGGTRDFAYQRRIVTHAGAWAFGRGRRWSRC